MKETTDLDEVPMDVLTAAWQASGRPIVTKPTTHGACARCGRGPGPLAPTNAVVSKVFTGFDGWRNPSGCGLCPGCAWAYRTPKLRRHPHLVTVGPPRLATLRPAQLAVRLSAPLAADVALVVPLRPGRKHLLPAANWGRVTVEDALLTWTSADVNRLAAMRRLRALGFGSRMLAGPAPTWPVLRRLPRSWWGQVLDDWAALDPWRTRPPWLALGVRASYPGSTVAAA